MRRGRGRETFSILKRETAKIWWDPRRNLPLLDEKLGSPAIPLHATPPRDVRPVIGKWYKFVKDVVEGYLGVPVKRVVPWRRVVLGNKVQYPDYGEEIIVDGQVVGHVIYDLREKRWRFRPLYKFAERIVEERVGFYAVIDLPRLGRGFEIHRGDVVEALLPEERDEYVSLATVNGGFFGVGVMARRGRIYVLKAWRRARTSFLDEDPAWRDVVEANLEVLEEKEREAVEFIRSLKEKYGLPFYVSFSGGKDSLVTLHLARLALGDIKVIFNDTGIEFPDTVRYVKWIAERYGLDLEVAAAGEGFWRGFESVGPPARDFRWCCKVVKFSPTAKLLRKLFPGGAIGLVGQRKYESSARAKSPRVWKNKWFPKGLAASPIHEWTALDVWLYIFWRKLVPNKLYYEGFDRLGCWLCPATELGELELASHVEPELYADWMRKLESYSKRHDYPSEWVEYGLWRWIDPPRDILRMLGKNERWYPEKRGADIDVKEEEGGIRLLLSNSKFPADAGRMRNILHTVCSGASVEVRGNSVHVSLSGKCGAEDVVRAAVRSFYCAECLECANWCPTGAIYRREDGGIGVREDKCLQCGVCNEKCPIAEYTLKVRGRAQRR